MSAALELLLDSDFGRLSLFTTGFVLGMGLFPLVWLARKSRGPRA
ncbi:DUF3149 domain-containing protein [Pelomicrobium sp.]|jgi:hypothetical protein